MGEILVSATVLILLVLVLRNVTKGKLSMRFRYALWLVVALRLIVPVSYGSSPFSAMNLALEGLDYAGRMAESVRAESQWESSRAEETGTVAEGSTDTSGSGGMSGNQKQLLTDNYTDTYALNQGTAVLSDGNSGEKNPSGYSLMEKTVLRLWLLVIWGTGMLATGGYMLVCHIRFVRSLHRMRTEVPAGELPAAWTGRMEEGRMHVYTVKGLPGPCLVGRSIYVEPQMLLRKDKLSHILAHEYMHEKQGDTFWAFLRSMLCAVYWFYPLVWAAACASKKDSELACDEGAIRILGEAERFAYGRTLLDLLTEQQKGSGHEGVVWIMDGGESHVKERVSAIAGRRKRSRATAVLAAAVMLAAAGCAFSGAEPENIPAGGNTGELILTNSAGTTHENMETTGELQEAVQADGQRLDGEPGQKEGAKGQEAESRAQEEYERDAEDVAAFGEEQQAFEQVLFSMDDSGLVSATDVDMTEYMDYLYEGAACPMEDGDWYILPQLHAEETGIEFYGLYTEEYGCRGMKIRIGDDVNTFDQPWQPVSFRMPVMILEESKKDGMPRIFAFSTCVVNSSFSEIWRLYVADRYDTGTVELFCFEEKDYRKQMDDRKLSVRVVQAAEESALLCDDTGAVIDTVDISGYAEEDVEEAVWDNGSFSFLLEEEGDSRIALATGIGLKEAGSDKIFYRGLPLILFPVETGSFGDHKFALGEPYVSGQYVSGKQNR